MNYEVKIIEVFEKKTTKLIQKYGLSAYIFDKSEQESISGNGLKELLKSIP